MRKLAVFAMLAFAALAVPGAQGADNVAVGHSGWIWGNPQPQGNTLNDLAFAGGSGYAVGDDGVVLKTENGGITWRGLALGGIRPDLDRVRALDANVLFVGGGCVLRRSDDGGATFARVRATSGQRRCSAEVESFSFIEPMTGYALLSNGSVKRTTDGGHTFDARAALPGTAAAGGAPPVAPTDVWFLSSETGLALAGKIIHRTTDGGASWSPAFTATEELNGLYFVSASTGYATGDAKTLLKTTDGGVTWTPVVVPPELPAADLTGVRCAAEQQALCLIATRQGDQVLRTANGGAVITSVAPYVGRKVLAAAFNSANVAAAVGQGGASAVSADAGRNWAPVGVSVGTGLDRLRALPSGAVNVAGAAGALSRTTNGGGDWSNIAVPTAKRIVDVSFPDAAGGFALDAGGTLFSTVDGGTHWTPRPATGVDGARAVFAPTSTTVLLLGSEGVARSTDGGATFNRLKPATPALTDYDRAGGSLVLYGPRALITSGSRGGGRKAVDRPGGPTTRIAKADFFSRKHGYVLARSGRLWLTRNAGKSWFEIRTTGTSRAYDMAWGDKNTGYVAVDKLAPGERAGYVLRSDDRGKHWRPQLVAPTPLRRRGLVATARRNLVALARGSQLLYTGSGGDRGETSTLTIEPSTLEIRRPRKITIAGQLLPAVAGAEVHVAFRNLGGGTWKTRVAKPTGPGGRFSLKVRIKKPSVVVARWLGNAELNGAGSNIVAIQRSR
jgi:photosystem II stability/assembly factor-like uncharacterized protein